jgi:hypothetical protein
MYFNARYYSQTLGRFVSADSIVPGARNPQALNRYAFVVGNPLKYTDPSGHFFWIAGTILGGAVIGATVNLAIQVLPQITNQLAAGKSIGELQVSLDVGQVAGAAISGAVYGGIIGLMPAAAGVAATLAVGAVAGAASGQAGRLTEAIVDDKLDDGSINSLAERRETYGIGSPSAIVSDAVVGSVSAGIQLAGSALAREMQRPIGAFIGNAGSRWAYAEHIPRASRVTLGERLRDNIGVGVREALDKWGPELLSQLFGRWSDEAVPD